MSMTAEGEAAAPFIHPLAWCESRDIGAGTKIWAFAQVMAGVRIGDHCAIGGHAFLESGVVVGNRVTIKNQVMIWSGVVVEDDVFLGPGVVFTNDRYPRSPRRADLPAVTARYQDPSGWQLTTLVRQGASLGAGAVILPGLEIGANALVAAGAVVTRPVAPQQLVAGNPARPRGWVCHCGYPLDGSPQPICLQCRQQYLWSTPGRLQRVQESVNV